MDTLPVFLCWSTTRWKETRGTRAAPVVHTSSPSSSSHFKSHSLCLLCKIRSRTLSEERQWRERETDGDLKDGGQAEGLLCKMNDTLLKSTF